MVTPYDFIHELKSENRLNKHSKPHHRKVLLDFIYKLVNCSNDSETT